MGSGADSERSRRSLLAGAVAGVVAYVVGAARPSPVRGANGDTVTVGGSFTGTSSTSIANTTPGAAGAIRGTSPTSGTGIHGESHSGTGVHGLTQTGESAIFGLAAGSGIGIFGRSQSGPGVRGVSDSATGEGVTGFGDGLGVRGESQAGTGVLGLAPDGVGVSGQSTSAVGVSGESQTGIGVNGRNGGSGTGVEGFSPDGDGVDGISQRGVGVRASTGSGIGLLAFAQEGIALEAQGPVRFSTAALGLIPAGASSATIALLSAVVPISTKVLCTLQSDPGNVALKFAHIEPSGEAVTVVLSGKVKADTVVACFAIS